MFVKPNLVLIPENMAEAEAELSTICLSTE